jgi:hypothetical protein
LLAEELVVLILLKLTQSVESEEAVTQTNHQIVLLVLQERLDLQIWAEALAEELILLITKMEDLE